MAAERRFRAMGTDAAVTVVAPSRLAERLADDATGRLARLEARWSRFRPDSEITALNRAGGREVVVSDDTVVLVLRAVEAWRRSAQFLDCTMLDEVVAAGYDRSFDELPADRPAPPAPRPGPRFAGPDDIRVRDRAVALPAGVGFDPGGIGKGLAADLVAGEVMAAGADGVCVAVGGDLRVRGLGPDGGAWTVSIDHPDGGEPLALVGLSDGAVATSTTRRRRWRIAGRSHHHLIDPRTGEPAESGIELASVVAAEGWQAEAFAKAVLIRGGPHPFDLVDGTGVEALVVGDDGAVATSDGFGRFLGAGAVRTSARARPDPCAPAPAG